MSGLVRNVIYHVCPLWANDLWQANVRQLCRRMREGVFNGRRVIAIATGEGLWEPCDVENVFGDLGAPPCEFITCPNDRKLREVATFLPLLESIADPDPGQVVFYAHTKGNSTACGVEGATYWRNAMYHHLLDRWQDCMRELSRPGIAAVGTHKMTWRGRYSTPFPTRLDPRHGWIFAGTFFWFRHDRVFADPAWRNVPQDRYGAEGWLGGFMRPEEGVSVYQPGDEFRRWNPYDPALYPDQIPDDGE